jgi:hypothetical protein
MALFDGTHAPSINIYLDKTNRTSGKFILSYSELNGADVLGTNAVPFTTLQQLNSNNIKSITIRRGRTREDQVFQAGQLTFVMDNISGNYDPQQNVTALQGSDGESILCGKTGVRVTATYAGTEYVIYSGYIEQIILNDGFAPTAEFICVDAISQLSTQVLHYQNYNNLYDRDVINHILTQVGWPSTFRDVSSYEQVIAENADVKETAFNICHQVAAMQMGKFFIDRFGKPTFRTFSECFGSTGGERPAYRMLLSDQRPPVNDTDIEYDYINVSGGEKYIVNTVTINNSTGDAVRTNAASVARYGGVRKELPGYFYFSSDAALFAQRMSIYWGTPAYRCERVEFDGYGLTDWYSILTTEIGDGATVDRQSVYRSKKRYNCLVESIDHDITPDNWRVSLQFSPDSI